MFYRYLICLLVCSGLSAIQVAIAEDDDPLKTMAVDHVRNIFGPNSREYEHFLAHVKEIRQSFTNQDGTVLTFSDDRVIVNVAEDQGRAISFFPDPSLPMNQCSREEAEARTPEIDVLQNHAEILLSATLAGISMRGMTFKSNSAVLDLDTCSLAATWGPIISDGDVVVRKSAQVTLFFDLRSGFANGLRVYKAEYQGEIVVDPYDAVSMVKEDPRFSEDFKLHTVVLRPMYGKKGNVIPVWHVIFERAGYSGKGLWHSEENKTQVSDDACVHAITGRLYGALAEVKDDA